MKRDVSEINSYVNSLSRVIYSIKSVSRINYVNSLSRVKQSIKIYRHYDRLKKRYVYLSNESILSIKNLRIYYR